MKEVTHNYDYALLMVAGALLAGGVLGIYLGAGKVREAVRAAPVVDQAQGTEPGRL